ncbi:MAG: nucleotidyl transferase AbiEii/AbiGii toxin family protein [Leadbetterella sp.]|nr:nucleotidyl transferase AbiEii/AbiGii toxin family protein [Leadbetterella sp.]
MLQTQTVEPGTFALLKQLMVLPELVDFHLVGGTALSLLYGHRNSIDLDLFTFDNFDNEKLINTLTSVYGESFVVRTAPPFGIFCYINSIKVDLIKYRRPIIRPVTEIDGIRMFSIEDIMVMKIQAILGRGRKKDFWDIAELLEHYSVKDFVNFHKEKFSTQNLLITVPQAMLFFEDADEDENPVSLKGQTWESVKSNIREKVREYLK